MAAMLLLVVPLLTLEADARGGGGGGHGGGHGFGGHGGGFGGHRGGISFGARGGGGFRAAHIGRAHVGRAHIGRAHIGRTHIGSAHVAARSVGGSRSQRAGVAAARLGGAGNRFATAAHTLGGAAARMGDPGRRVFGNRAIANVALQSQFGQARFHGAFFGSALPWWRGGLVLGWFGPQFWPYAYYDLFDYVYWPYAYDDFWPYAYDDVYYGIYGPYAYSGPYGYRPYGDPTRYYAGRSARRGVSSGRYAARANGTERGRSLQR